MIRALLDANVLVSGFPAPGRTTSALIDRWRAGQFQLISSQHILAEVERAWIKPYWQARFGPELVERALALLRQEAVVTPLTVMVSGVASHPEDDLELAAAVSAQVDYLVTGDRMLQRLGSYQGVSIRSPRAFLDLLAAEG